MEPSVEEIVIPVRKILLTSGTEEVIPADSEDDIIINSRAFDDEMMLDDEDDFIEEWFEQRVKKWVRNRILCTKDWH